MMPRSARASITLGAGLGRLDRELVEEMRRDHLDAGHLRQRVRERHRVGVVQRGELAQARLAEQRQMRGERQRAQARVRADIAGRLLAADMLLARGERQHEAAPAIAVERLAAKPPRHLAHEFLAGGEQAEIRAAEIEAIAD